jgi:hypothetical protein
MNRDDEVEEVIEEEEEKAESPKRGGGYKLVFDVEDLAIREAVKDVLAVNEEIPKEPPVKSQELREFIDFKNECEALMSLIGDRSEDQELNILSENFTLEKAMELAKKLVGIDGREEGVYIEGEPSPYAQELFRKIWQKYIDCKWFFAMLRGKKPTTPKDLKFAKPPEDLLKIEGEKI